MTTHALSLRGHCPYEHFATVRFMAYLIAELVPWYPANYLLRGETWQRRDFWGDFLQSSPCRQSGAEAFDRVKARHVGPGRAPCVASISSRSCVSVALCTSSRRKGQVCSRYDTSTQPELKNGGVIRGGGGQEASDSE